MVDSGCHLIASHWTRLCYQNLCCSLPHVCSSQQWSEMSSCLEKPSLPLPSTAISVQRRAAWVWPGILFQLHIAAIVISHRASQIDSPCTFLFKNHESVWHFSPASHQNRGHAQDCHLHSRANQTYSQIIPRMQSRPSNSHHLCNWAPAWFPWPHPQRCKLHYHQ